MKILSALTAVLLTVSMVAQDRDITVSGTAKLMVDADEMVISTGISSDNDDPNELQKNMQNKMAEAIKYLKGEKGVKSVETDVIRIYNRGPQKKSALQKQYQGRQMVTIVLTDFELYDALMVKLFEMGFNNINNAYFRLSSMTTEKQNVQLLAIQAAKQKAAIFANELEVNLGPVISFKESGVYAQPTRYTANARYDAVTVEGGESSSVEASKVSIEMTVIVSFAIKSEEEK